MDYDILYKSSMSIRLEVYKDVVWAGYKADRRSTLGFASPSGVVQYLGISKKQSIVTLLVASYEVIWLKRILKDLDVSINDPILTYCNNLETRSSTRN